MSHLQIYTLHFPLPQKGQDHNVYTSNQIHPLHSSIVIYPNNLELTVSGHTVTTRILPLPGESIDFYFKAQINSLNKPNLENLAKKPFVTILRPWPTNTAVCQTVKVSLQLSTLFKDVKLDIYFVSIKLFTKENYNSHF